MLKCLFELVVMLNELFVIIVLLLCVFKLFKLSNQNTLFKCYCLQDNLVICLWRLRPHSLRWKQI